MGGSEEEAGSSRQKKMDESEGMCRADANYDSCWGRICNPNRGHVLKDILRGLLVLIVLAIVITVIFLLCYFLLNDIEKKEDEVIDNLVKEFSAGGPDPPNPIPEISTNDINENSPNDSEIYDSGPLRGDLGKEKGNLLNEQSNKIELRDPENKFPVVTVFAPSSPSLGNNGENVKIVKPPFLIAEVHANAEEVPEEKNIFKEEPLPEDTQGFIPVQNSPQGNTEGLLEFNFNQDQDGQVFDNFSDFVVAESGADCVPLRLPLCSSSMPWSLTAFPNWVNNNNMNELQDSLKYFQSTIIGGRCSVRATEYSCAILEPACGPDGIPLPPCKAFCEDIFRSCSEYLSSDSKHRIALQCDRFPDSKNPNVCVDINRTPSVTTDSKMTDANSNLPHGTTINRQDITQPQFNDFSNIARNPSDDDYPTDTYDEVSGREDLLSPPLLDTVSTDEAKIVELADLQKDVKKLPEPSQFTPEPVQPIIGDSVPQQEFDNIPEEVGSSDGGTTELPVFICDHTKFLCEDGSDCLSQESVCDGIQHCLDNSDEGNCTAPEPDISEAQEDLIVAKTFDIDSPPLKSSSRRPSLSEMLSGSSLVAVPEVVTEPPTPRPELKLRFSSDQPFKPIRAKSLDSGPKPLRNSFEPFPSTVKPTLENDVNSKNSKLSLAALLSTSIAPTQRHVGAHSQNHPIITFSQDLDLFPTSNRRSLSDLLASSSFSSVVTRDLTDQCPELQCLDGKCISVTQLGDGFEDCADGADEH